MTLQPGDEPTLGSYGPPTVGSSDPSYFWQNPSGWSKSSLFSEANFPARITASVPEPGAALQWGASGLALLLLCRPPRR